MEASHPSRPWEALCREEGGGEARPGQAGSSEPIGLPSPGSRAERSWEGAPVPHSGLGAHRRRQGEAISPFWSGEKLEVVVLSKKFISGVDQDDHGQIRK